MAGDKDDCPGRIVNNDGTFTAKITVGQEDEDVTETEGEVLLIVDEAIEAIANLDEAPETNVDLETPARVLPTSRDGNNWYRIAICDAK